MKAKEVSEINEEANSYLSFKLGKETFAIHVSSTQSITEVSSITTVPQSPDYMAGLIDLRGKALPLIDLRTIFGMSKTEITKNTSVLVVSVKIENELIELACLVDSVEEVLELIQSEILPPPKLTKNSTDLFYGIVKINSEFIMMVDLESVFRIVDLESSRTEEYLLSTDNQEV